MNHYILHLKHIILYINYTSIKKNKQLKTTLLGRNIRSRELHVCRFSICGISGAKTDTASDSRESIYLRACSFLLFLLMLWIVSSGKIMLRNHICILRTYLQRHQHNSFACSHCIQRKKDLEMLKMPTSPVFCLRRNSGTMNS